MTLVSRIFGIFLDSPTYSRDRANLISGTSIGIASLLLNGAVLMIAVPLLNGPDSSSLAQTIEFGQLMALILLGGATAFATVLIPLRLATVFLEPRIGRYFDQIVLSGIAPLRFLIGKVTSQNLFLGLVLFLLLPYFVFSLTLGGVNLISIAAGLVLVWLYCMELALVTIWFSLYLNEVLAALLVIFVAGLTCIFGCAPMPYQPFVFTPFPLFVQPVYEAVPRMHHIFSRDYWPTFAACIAGMSLVCMVSLIAIHLGPIFGIIGENSTFGEVIRAGDSKRKRASRLRPHIQRPSEITFFYQNRVRSPLSSEGLIRWGFGFITLTIGFALCNLLHVINAARNLANWRSGAYRPWWAFEFHAFNLIIMGIAIAAAAIVFSHPRNSTYLRIPFFRGRTVEISKLDTTAFLLFILLTTAVSVAIPFLFEQYYAAPNQQTIFPPGVASIGGQSTGEPAGTIDFDRIAIEGALLIFIEGLLVYGIQRMLCLTAWMRSVAAFGTALLYLILVGGIPLMAGVIILSTTEINQIQLLSMIAPSLAVISPFMKFHMLFDGGMGMPFPTTTSAVPFYVVHGLLICLVLFEIRRRGRNVRKLYLVDSVQGLGMQDPIISADAEVRSPAIDSIQEPGNA